MVHGAPQPPRHSAVSVAAMQQVDAAAIERLGIPRLLLMDHAGLAVARAVQTLLPAPSSSVLVCCGTGLNGGDGLAAARHLHGWGYPLHVVVTGRLDGLREEPTVYAKILQRLGLLLVECLQVADLTRIAPWWSESGVIIDALLGIGAQGAVREPAASLIAAMNRSGTPIVSADIPSGLDGDTGRVEGVAVNATVTATFGLPKRGCFIEAGPAHTGRLIVDPITIPPVLLTSA